MAKKPIRTRRKATTDSVIEQIKENAFKKVEPRKIDLENLIPSGSTLLNCACSDNPFGAYGLGKIVTTPGASKSGKTILELTTFAECNRNSRFDEYDFFYDDVEESLEFDMEYLFGPDVSNRIQPPAYDSDVDGAPLYSDTIQDLEDNIFDKCRRMGAKPFIYVIDSLDALTTTEEVKKEFERLIARAKSDEAVKELKGSYNTEKARILGQTLRMIKSQLASSRSTLIIVQQERQKIGTSFGKKMTTSGGEAPFFYSTHQIWLHRLEAIKSKDRKIGVNCRAEVTKNKLTGKERDVNFKIYYDYGIDDVSSCVDFLCKNHWKKARQRGKELPGTWDAEEFGFAGSQATLIQKIEEGEREREMQKLVGQVWNEIEESIRLSDRKRRF